MTPSGPVGDPRLDDLFVRYLDGALAGGELAALDRRLAADPAARAAFQAHAVQSVAVSEWLAVTRPRPAGDRPPTRRRALRYLGAGLAAGVTGGAVGWVGLRDAGGPSTPADGPVRLAAARGEVTVRTADGLAHVPLGGVVPIGSVVATHGFDATARLVGACGSGIVLAGDGALAVAAGRRLVLVRGDVSADVRPGPAAPLVLATAAADVSTPAAATLALGHAARATEVGVRTGAVTVSAPSGEPLAVVGAGEMLTVREGGGAGGKRPLPVAPDEFAWDLSRPLPDDWHVGRREAAAGGPVVRPEFWFDPFHNAEMWQVRSDKQWFPGFVRLLPDSVVQVRYQVDRPGFGQVVVCVRSDTLPDAQTAVVELNTTFAAGRPGGWQRAEARVGDMLDNPNGPRFGPPWIGFLVIMNTYRADLGLRVAEFRVSRTGGPAGRV